MWPEFLTVQLLEGQTVPLGYNKGVSDQANYGHECSPFLFTLVLMTFYPKEGSEGLLVLPSFINVYYVFMREGIMHL